MYMSSKWRPIGPIGVLALLEFNFKVDSTFYYKESIKLKYLI